jgi:hypothetical protein
MARYCVEVAGEYSLDWPLWDDSDHADEEVDVDELEVSRGLRRDLRQWARAYRSPAHEPELTSMPEFTRWVDDGRELAVRLTLELGPDYDVTYFDELTGESNLV